MAIKYLGNTISGLAGDTKPTLSSNEKGVIFIETDTGKVYQWDGDSWEEIIPTSAPILTTARTIGMTGDVVWTSPSFDGSGNITAAAAIGSGVVVNADVKSDAAIALSKTALVAGTGITLATNTLNVDAAQTQVTSVGALNVGSITSGFTSIDVGAGAITTTGTVTAGNLNVTGTTTTINSTNSTISDRLIELASGAGSSTADAGIVIERGSTGDNAIMAWDESQDRFIFGTTQATGASTGDLAITAGNIEANLIGNVTGTITVADTTDTTSFVALFESATGDLAPKTDAGITYNAGTGMLSATGFTGPLTGTLVTASQTAITGVGTITTGVWNAGAVTSSGAVTGASLDISGNADIDGTTNLDAVDIDGDVDLDGNLTLGASTDGYDVKFYGAASGEYLYWDETKNSLLALGGAQIGVGNEGFTPVSELELLSSLHQTAPTLTMTLSENAIVANHVLANIDFRGTDTAGGTGHAYARVGARIKALADDTWGTDVDDNPSRLEFMTQTNGNTNELATRLTIDSAGDVGIGITDPDTTLHVHASSAGTVDAVNSQFAVESSGNTGINILSGTTSNGAIFFGDSGDADIGRIYYDHGTGTGGAANRFVFFTDGGERMTIASNGRVGIDVKTPATTLHVNASGGAGLRITRDSQTGWLHLDTDGTNAHIANPRSDGTLIFKVNGDNERMRIDGTGLTTITGTIKITGGSPGTDKVLRSDSAGLATWVTASGGGGLVEGGTVIDPDTAYQYVNKFDVTGGSHEPSLTLESGSVRGSFMSFLDDDGARFATIGSSDVTTGGTAGLHDLAFATDSGHIRFWMNAWENATATMTLKPHASANTPGYISMGTTTVLATDSTLSVQAGSAAPLAVNRNTNDGNLIYFYQGGSQEGAISVSGSNIVYGTFTGAHYAVTTETIDRGMLVSMTGTNERLGGRAASEILYGVVKSTVANDSKLLGTYLSLQEPDDDVSTSNPYLIAAVGNGPMWIADKGANITVGDYLISSDIAGHAMKDDGTYAVSYIIGRATENIDWSTVTDTVGSTKHKVITVTYESFKNVEGRLTVLEARIAALES